MDVMGLVDRKNGTKGLAELLHNLDEKSRAILYYLWWHRHAEISELRNIVDLEGDSDVLYRLKEVINKKSQDLWGAPIVGFEQSKVDPLTGEKALFSWWYLGEEDFPPSVRDSALVDVFNEKDNVIIIAQLPAPVNIGAPDMQFKNGILRIRFKKTRPVV